MKTTERQQQGPAGDLIFKMKKNKHLFYYFTFE